MLLVPFIFAVLFFVGAAGFGLWAFSQREDYRLRTEQKIADAVKVARQEEGIAKDKQHAEADKQPLKVWAGPEQFGSVRVSYPKTWSGYVNTTSGGQPVDGYFHPDVVPGTGGQTSVYALRVQVVNQQYANVVKSFSGSVTGKQAKASAYAFPRVPGVVGTKYEGAITSRKVTGIMVVVPLRDKTLQVWTESPSYTADFNTHILPHVTFSP